ncbi:MAG: hypothetical protein KBD24_03940 [Candidatus Pacebacteria bacterium]|nr:hypothetical protein [Candidatus Paceibacterota bacterium]
MKHKDIAIFVGFTLIALGGVTAYSLYSRDTAAQQVAVVQETQQTLVPTQPSSTVTAPPVVPVPQQNDALVGWSTYVNDVYKYEIKYPAGVSPNEATEADFEFNLGLGSREEYVKYTGKLRVEIGGVYVSAPPNKNCEYVHCGGRTGVGADTVMTERDPEKIVIDGREYDLQATEFRDPGSYEVDYRVTLDDGTKFFCASDENGRQCKEIIQSYKKLK